MGFIRTRDGGRADKTERSDGEGWVGGASVKEFYTIICPL